MSYDVDYSDPESVLVHLEVVFRASVEDLPRCAEWRSSLYEFQSAIDRVRVLRGIA